MGFMELRAGTIGFRLPSFPLLLVSTTQKTQNLRTIKRLASGSRSKKTGKKKKQKQKRRVSHFYFYFCKKNGIFLITPRVGAACSFKMLHKFFAWTCLSNFDQSENTNWTQSMTSAWAWKATVFPACNSWLNFRVRGQFEIKTFINTTFLMWIFFENNLEPAII